MALLLRVLLLVLVGCVGPFPPPAAMVVAASFDVVVWGSSVSRGYGATNAPGTSVPNGYSKMLQDEIAANRNETLSINGVNGYTTTTTYNKLVSDMAGFSFAPLTVVIGLSTANEGLLSQTTSAGRDAIAAQYEDGIERIVNRTLGFGVKTLIVGSVYPQNNYDANQYATLLQVFNRQKARLPELAAPCAPDCVVAMADFLTDLDDGNGHWNAGDFSDAGHPNDSGYTKMFQSLNATYYNVTAGRDFNATVLTTGTTGSTGSTTAVPTTATTATTAATTAVLSTTAGGGAVSAGSTTATPASSTVTGSPGSVSDSTTSAGLSAGGVVGIVTGGIVLVLLIGAGVLFILRKRKFMQVGNLFQGKPAGSDD